MVIKCGTHSITHNNIAKPTYLSYDYFMDSINKLERDSLYHIARNLAINYLENTTNNWFAVSKELIYINENLGNYEDNMLVFSKGHRAGYFYLIHPSLPKFKPYLTLERFDSISRTDLKMRSQSLEKSNTIYEVHLPNNYQENRMYPLIIIFHGGGSNLEKVKNHWQSPLVDSAFIKIYLQSYRYYDSQTFGWRSGDKRSDDDIIEIYTQILEDYQVDTSCILVAGISAGGTYASDIALRNVIPVKGVISFCQGIPKNLSGGHSNTTLNSNTIYYMVGGDKDFYLNRQLELVDIFLTNNIIHNHIIVDNMVHEYPENEQFFIENGINFIYQKSQ